MDYLRMQTVVRTLLGQTNTSNTFFDTNNDIKPMINDSQIVVARDTEALLTFCNYTTTSGLRRYSLKRDYLKAKDMILMNHGTIGSVTRKWKMQFLTVPEWEDITGPDDTRTGKPFYWKIELGAVDQTPTTGNWPGDFWVDPKPDSNGGNDYILQFRYYQKPDAMVNDTDISELPDHMHMAVCYHAAMHLSMLEQDRRLYGDLNALYNQELSLIRQSINKEQRIRPTRTRDVMGYSYRVGPGGRRLRRRTY